MTDTDNTVTGGDLAQSLKDRFTEQGAKIANPEVHFHKFEIDGVNNPIAGILLERRERAASEKSAGGHYYIIGLTEPTKLVDSDGNSVDGQPGMFAWVDERWCIQSLENFLPKVAEHNGLRSVQEVHEVLIIPVSKTSIGKGRTLWKAEVYTVAKKPRPDMPLIAPKVNKPPPELPASEQGDIPF